MLNFKEEKKITKSKCKHTRLSAGTLHRTASTNYYKRERRCYDCDKKLEDFIRIDN